MLKNKLIIFVIIQTFFVNNALANTSFLQKARDMYNVKIRGIIHIGAADGGENAFYKSLKATDVLWIEANPEAYKKLLERVEPEGIVKKVKSYFYTSTMTANFAASDKDGFADFFITDNKDSSSLLELGLHQNVYPNVLPEKTIRVTTKRLDNYFKESGNDPKKYNIIVIDVQGAELLALKGAVNTLQNIDCIVSEISPDEMYKGSVKIYELDAFLLENDFVRLDTSLITKICGDALYVKKDVIRKSIENL